MGWALVVPLLLAACVAAPELPPVKPYDATALGALHYKVVLIAGGGQVPVFDNAVEGVAERLSERGSVAPGDIQRLSSDSQRLSVAPAASSNAALAREGMRSVSVDHMLDAVAAMKPGAGQGCFVFATSDGTLSEGLRFRLTGEWLTPYALDRALVQGCGDAPTAVVISGCFTGIFADRPMVRANRVVLTAARWDRNSFGCVPGRTYAVFDRCLLEALDAGGTWQQAYALVQRCVAAEERSMNVAISSYPQAWFGPAVAGLPLPVRAEISKP